MGRPRVSCVVRVVALLLAGPLALSGCSYGHQEPGLFGRGTDPGTVTPPATSAPEPDHSSSALAVNPDLPVVGEAVWRSADGRDVQVRIALHAVRRIRGATVLDWSVTPLPTPGLATGDSIPGGVRLGLARYGPGELNVFLVDPLAGQVYRPLTLRDPSQQQGCLCSPIGLVERSLRIGQTRLLQVTYPELPATTATIDVDVSTVPMFWNVPVTPLGHVPAATNAVDLARPADVNPDVSSTRVFRYAPTGQQFLISVDSVLASSGFTSLTWTIQSVTAGAGLDSVDQPPFADTRAGRSRTVNAAVASGPQLRVRATGAVQSARMMTARLVGPGLVECLCSDLRLWTVGLRSASQRASVVTNLPPLPIGTQTVDVVFPGVATVSGVAVTSASDATVLSAAPRPAPSKTWTYHYRDPVVGWSLDSWPTPVPQSRQLDRYQATVERLVR